MKFMRNFQITSMPRGLLNGEEDVLVGRTRELIRRFGLRLANARKQKTYGVLRFGNSRVAPINPVTISRLELSVAIFLGSRLEKWRT